MTLYGNFPWNYIRIYTDDAAGLYGTGECFLTPGFAGILEDFIPLLIGGNISRPKEIVNMLRSAASGAGSDGGLAVNVITGIEAALLDAYGKYAGVSLAQLFGGRLRDSVRVYADCHGGSSLETLNEVLQPMHFDWAGESDDSENPEDEIRLSAERARMMKKEGYDFLKFDLDVPGSRFDSAVGYPLSSGELDWMVNLVAAVRDAAGPETEIAFDAHWRYRPKEMLRFAREAEPYRLAWLEDPVPASDIEGLEFIRSRTTTPVATGENHQRIGGFKPLINHAACDVVTPDLQKSGGLYESAAVVTLAGEANMAFAPHMIGSPLAMMTTAQFSSTFSNFLAMEFHGADVPFYGDLVTPHWDSWYSPGSVSLTDAPGIGVELNPAVVRRYLRSGSRAFQE